VCSYWEIAKKDGKPGTESKVGISVDNDPKNHGGSYSNISSKAPPADESNAGDDGPA
jgi:acyl CoA:acetate/3-ketoacid CoA transferase